MAEENKKSDVAKREEDILKFWQDNKIFKKSLEKGGEPFVFYDGPPFATGTPHYGHMLPGVIKDVIPRYQTMRGKFVERQWGWDTHGLPIENIVEKELGVKSKKEIEEKIGIEKFNNLCRERIFTYVDVWNHFMPRFGRWADMENPYITMHPSYMESEWWAFKELYDKGLIYKDYRSMHICPRCETTLAQAEVAEGYKDIKDLSVTVKFHLKPGQEFGNGKYKTKDTAYILAWTTTPWTLPGNVALAVGKDIAYTSLRLKGVSELLVVASNLIEKIFDNREIEIVHNDMTGNDLVGLEYKPLFDDYAKKSDLENRENGWKVYAADFVTTEEGTGVVHIAPAFGEDDMNLGKEKNLPFVQHIGMDGVIKPEVKDLAGLSVKPIGDHQTTDVEVMKLLDKKDLLFSKEKYEHSYPHCWRCDTPLLNFATSSWFVAVTKVKEDLLKLAEDINWSPTHIKKGRWLEWLKGARDWSISRQRYWANTIPVWENGEGKRVAVGSVEELKSHMQKSGNTYFVIRHGQAKSNAENYLDSGNDETNHLTEGGKSSVLAKAKELRGEGIELIISSPVLRTKETAEIIAEELGLEVVYDERIKEKNFGEHDMFSIPEHDGLYKDVRDKFNMKCPGGEDEKMVRVRMGEFMYDIDSKYKNKKILIVSHGTPIHFLFGLAKGEQNKETLSNADYFKNAEVRALDFVSLPHNNLYELDLHRPYIDQVKLVDENGSVYKRVTDVLDTWFDSGSVPFSSYHYPFENKEEVHKRIPADFIAEGLDQVSKWFYYQHVLGGALFGKTVFSNVVVNGIVLAEDGKKMSKRLNNYPDPVYIIDKYGADATRFYFLSSPSVRAENLNFSESGVDEIYKKIILRLQNVLSFYELYEDKSKVESQKPKENVLDKWILLRLAELNSEVTTAMDSYELDKATRPFLDFVDDLSTWYLRRSRERLKGGDKEAISTMKFVLMEVSKLLAPFVPFLAEDVYKRVGGEKESVHLEGWPEVGGGGFLSSIFGGGDDSKLLEEMKKVREIVSLGLEARSKTNIKVRQPLIELKVSSSKYQVSRELVDLIKDEVNVKDVKFAGNLKENVELDMNITPELQAEGDARELIRAVQDMRKKEGLKPSDKVILVIDKKPDFVGKYEGEIKSVCGLSEMKVEDNNGDEVKVGENSLRLEIR